MKTAYQRRTQMTPEERKIDSLRRANAALASLKAELAGGVMPCREFTLKQAIINTESLINGLIFS